MERKTHTIDAADKVLGRLASEIAILLQGKHKPDFLPYKDMGDFVIVKNVEKIRLTGKKIDQKKYYRHSGYLGHLKEIPIKKVLAQKPEEILKRAVAGMLPKNRLRKIRLKRLKFRYGKN
jgi:large subunit ribosomal protein L13